VFTGMPYRSGPDLHPVDRYRRQRVRAVELGRMGAVLLVAPLVRGMSVKLLQVWRVSCAS